MPADAEAGECGLGVYADDRQDRHDGHDEHEYLDQPLAEQHEGLRARAVPSPDRAASACEPERQDPAHQPRQRDDRCNQPDVRVADPEHQGESEEPHGR
jgi:hypothetical protein